MFICPLISFDKIRSSEKNSLILNKLKEINLIINIKIQNLILGTHLARRDERLRKKMQYEKIPILYQNDKVHERSYAYGMRKLGTGH